MACTDVFADKWMDIVISPALASDGMSNYPTILHVLSSHTLAGVYKPIETLAFISAIPWNEHGLCGDCVVDKEAEWLDERKRIWEQVSRWCEVEES